MGYTLEALREQELFRRFFALTAIPRGPGHTAAASEYAARFAAASMRHIARDVDSLPLKESALMLSVVTQHNYFNFDFKVEEVVMMGRTPHKRSMEMDNEKDRRIVREALEKVNMYDMRDRNFSSLSGGEQQRIILARALAQQTPCLVLDEPTNHLDIKYQLEVLDIVKGLGCTTLCALHDLNLAAEYCDRIYVLLDGRIVAEGAPEDVITESMIREVYGVRSTVEVNPHTGLLNVVYYPGHSLG